LKLFAEYLAESSAAQWATGFGFDKHISSVRLLGLALEDVEYRLFHLPLDLGDGAKQGMLMIGLPAEGVSAGLSGNNNDWSQTMQSVVGASHVNISAVLSRVQMALVDVQALKVGDLVPVPKSAVTSISMEGADGGVVGHARLGQQNGYRALRVCGADSGQPPMLEPNADLPAPNLPAMDSPAPIGGLDVVDMPVATTFPDPVGMPSEVQPAAAPMGDLVDLPDLPMAPLDDFPDLPMTPMGDLPDLPDLPMAPMGDLADLPMAPMSMDTEIA